MFFGLFKREPKPYDAGWLYVGDGHEIAYYQYGNPHGKPVLSFHGGPGGSAKFKYAAFHDLKKKRVILFDQRGCGQSKFKDMLRNNTTQDTLRDAEKLLAHLGVKGKITVAGGSFGSTCALLFAQKNPKRVERIIVNSVFLARRRDFVEWGYEDAKRFYPDIIERLENMAGSKPIVKYFHGLLFSSDRKKELEALKYYGCLEESLGALEPKFELPPKDKIDAYVKGLKIFMHYETNAMFIKENQILADARKIKHIPTFIAHNRLDMICPFEQAWVLHKALPKSKLLIVPDHGHGSDMQTKTFKKFIKARP
ncbi:MAG: alpha/beta fold hydrolase [Rickettsiales bacterium]|jgi:proline iminopeptidase|nr:alpha/beta fold hydrolase [Rickettsiales bacterium]